MRTTVDIHDSLLERAKKLAAKTGQRLSDVVNDALREMFDRRARQESQQSEQQKMPISEVGGRGLGSGLDLTRTGDLLDALDELDQRDPRTGPPPQLNELR